MLVPPVVTRSSGGARRRRTDPAPAVVRRDRLRLWAPVALAWATAGAGAAAPQAAAPVVFDIPAQPLASALEAWGAATGIGVFYDASLAARRQSAAVKGALVPERALELLLRGTGYAPRPTGPGAVSIMPTPSSREPPGQLAALRRPLDRFGGYFAVVQSRLGRVLCGEDHAGAGSAEVVFRFWVSASGVVGRGEIVASGGDPGHDRAIARRIEGLDLGAPPPGLPQPITMAVFPPAAGEATGCPAGDDGAR